MINLTVHDLLEAGVHFGHRTCYWNPKMAPYIFGARNGVHIINLEKTLASLDNAMNFLTNTVSHKGKVLFVATKLAARELVKEKAKECGMPYINYRWLGGMLTNYKTVRHSIRRLKELDEQFASEEFGQLTKKEVQILSRRREKLERALGGVKEMGGLPDVLLVIGVDHEDTAIKEANKLKIPVIGVVDTNTDPSNIDYLIPGNDDSSRAIKLYLDLAVQTILQAKSQAGSEEMVSEDEFVEVEAAKVSEPEAKEVE